MEENLKKKDWETAREQHANMLANSLLNIEAHKFMLKLCDENISKFPEDDPMPEEVKAIVEAVKK